MTSPDHRFGFTPKGKLSRLTPTQLNLLIGEVVGLMMLSPVHRMLQVRDVADIMLPALNLGQYRMYRAADKRPVGLVTWARFSPAVEQAYLGGRGMLSEAERTSGDITYVTDFIAPFGHARAIVKELRTQVFPNQLVKALRFVEQGKARPGVWEFRGVNYGKPTH